MIAPNGTGIFRRLAIPFSAFVLVASLALVAWIDWSYRRESLRQFRETAAANARIVDELRLPRSPELAENLATVLGVGVGFRFPGTTGTGLPPELESTIDTLAGDFANSGRVGGRDLAVAPLKEGSAHLVLLREGSGFMPGTLGWLLPSLIVTALGGGLAFLVARRIVRPLITLNRWLPNLDRENPEKIPEWVTECQDEIGSLACSLQEIHRRLREEQALRQQSERLAALGRIATSLAHEIRNPAAAIRLHADLLARQVPPEDVGGINLIRDEVDRISDLVNQWLFVARAAPPRTEDYDLAALTRKVLHRLAPQFDHAGVSALFDNREPAPVNVDGPRIEQVLRNLFINAMQAMPEGGEIRVQIRTEEEKIILIIRDEGPGFSMEALSRWSEPFFSEREGGMGLGLSLASEVMQAHLGDIEVGNESPGGASVSCFFPKSPPNEFFS